MATPFRLGSQHAWIELPGNLPPAGNGLALALQSEPGVPGIGIAGFCLQRLGQVLLAFGIAEWARCSWHGIAVGARCSWLGIAVGARCSWLGIAVGARCSWHGIAVGARCSWLGIAVGARYSWLGIAVGARCSWLGIAVGQVLLDLALEKGQHCIAGLARRPLCGGPPSVGRPAYLR